MSITKTESETIRTSDDTQEHDWQFINIKLIHWSLFSVIIVLAPFIIQSLMILTQGNHLSIVEILKEGQLLLVSSGIAAGAAGELFMSKAKGHKIKKTLAGWSAICIVLISSAWFGIISIEIGKPTFNEVFVTYGSIAIFVMTVISGIGCVLLAHIEGEEK